MDLLQAMKERHSVRSYEEKSIEAGTVEKLRSFIKECNKESGLHMQLVLDEPHAFEGFMAHYGKFSGVRNYIALIGRKGNDLEEKCGYYGEKVVLYAQTLGLNTCWVGLTYSKVKSAFQIDPGEKLCLVIAIGYGQTQGVSHKSTTPVQALKHCARLLRRRSQHLPFALAPAGAKAGYESLFVSILHIIE